MIDWLFIQQCHDDVLQELLLLVPLEKWHIKPQSLQLTDHKTKYGMADVDGVVYVNQAFIGSDAKQLLNATLRHELAHLCVGIHHGHDAVFKAQAKLFNAVFGKHLSTETQQINQAIGYKYKLYAILNNKEAVLVRRVHRKHRKYTHYKPRLFNYLTIKGHKVLAFRYED